MGAEGGFFPLICSSPTFSEELDVPSVTSQGWKLLASACVQRWEGILRQGGGGVRKSAIDMKQLMGALTSFFVGRKHNPKASVLPPTLTAKCRLNLQTCSSLILAGVKSLSSCLRAPFLVGGGGPAWKMVCGAFAVCMH